MKQPSRRCREGCFYAEKDPAEKADPNLPYHAEGWDAREIFSGREISEDCPMHRGREGENLDDSAGLTAFFSGGKIGG